MERDGGGAASVTAQMTEWMLCKQPDGGSGEGGRAHCVGGGGV